MGGKITKGADDEFGYRVCDASWKFADGVLREVALETFFQVAYVSSLPILLPLPHACVCVCVCVEEGGGLIGLRGLFGSRWRGQTGGGDSPEGPVLVTSKAAARHAKTGESAIQAVFKGALSFSAGAREILTNTVASVQSCCFEGRNPICCL